MLERSALVGRRLWEVIPQAASFLPTQPVLPTGSPAGLVSPQELARKRLPQVIMYTWSKDDAYSLEAARRLVELVPRDCLVVGVNLDLDCPQARSLGGELPGRQYYDQRGLEGDIARRLFLEKGFTVLITGRRGQILTLRGARNMERLGAFLSQ